jgi:hypothetical protein
MLRTTEEIKVRQTAEQTTSVVEAGQRADTGAASRNDGTERKPMVSWAALLDEAVKKPGFIHEAYSRFRNYSVGNQLLACSSALSAASSRGRSPLSRSGESWADT